MDCQIPLINKMVCDRISKKIDDFELHLIFCKNLMLRRSKEEIKYLNSEETRIKSLTKEDAITELIKSEDIYERLSNIDKFINSL